MALDKVALISMFVESAIWGLLVPLSAITNFLLLRKPSEAAKHIPHVVIVTTLLILGFIHLVLNFIRDSHALVQAEAHPDARLRNISDTLYRAKYGVLFVIIFIGDIVITSRCFHIWNKNYVAGIIPAILSIATLVCAGGTLRSLTNIANSGFTVDATVQKWFIATYVLALGTKLTCTGLVMWRVRQIHSELTRNVNRHVKIYTALFVLVESGSLTCLNALILVPLAITDIDVHVLFCDILSPVTGLAVMLIMIGTVIELSNNDQVQPHVIFHQNVPAVRPTVSTRANPSATNRWDDFEDMKGSPGTPTFASSPDYEDTNKSSGTLNMGIVV